MKTLIPMVAAGILAMGSVAIAAEGTGAAGNDAQHGGRMQGSPNAAGYPGKGDTTGSTTAGSQGSEMPRQGGRMQGPPNAAGFQQGSGGSAGGATGTPGSR
ncbi:hypothetical protein ACRAWG_26860 [Methylobacterium sp. P31]